MVAIKPEVRTATFQVKSVGSNEVAQIFTMKKGDIILSLHAVLVTKLGAGSTETTTIGDDTGGGGDVDGYGDNGDMDAEGTVGAIIRLGTDDTATGVTYKMPRVQPSDDTIDIVYTAGDASGVVPKWKIYMVIVPNRDIL